MPPEIPVNTILQGDCRKRMRELPNGCIHCVVTSPPYWRLRDYGIEPTIWGGEESCEHGWGPSGSHHRGGPPSQSEATVGRDQSARNATNDVRTGSVCSRCGAWQGVYGLEPTPDLYLEHTVEIFRAVRRVLRDDGTLWLNLGDSYSNDTKWGGKSHAAGGCQGQRVRRAKDGDPKRGISAPGQPLHHCDGLKPKDLVGMPWRVAFALQADGWYLRQDIIWHKPNPIPESVTDRCTKAHEYLFLLTKSPRYFYDAEAIKEAAAGVGGGAGIGPQTKPGIHHVNQGHGAINGMGIQSRKFDRPEYKIRNRRSVWTLPTISFHEAHFATFPPELIRPCIRAGTSEKGACPACGAPWERIVERQPVGDYALRGENAGLVYGMSRNHLGGQKTWTGYVPPRAVGWRPGCGCYETSWSERCDVLFEILCVRNRTRDTRKCHRQNRADSWGDRAYGYADRILMPREHAAFAAGPCLVLDPFGGAGTTGLVAAQEGRQWILIELKPEYVAMARRRIAAGESMPLWAKKALHPCVTKSGRQEEGLFP